MKKTILLILTSSSIAGLQAQPYLDIIQTKYRHSPDAGIFNRNKNTHTLTYSNISINAPLACKPIHGIVLVSPFYEQWNTSISSAALNTHQNFALALSFVDTVSTHTWRYAIAPIIRMKDFSKDGTSPAQLGVAGLAIFQKVKFLTWKFGFYFNNDYFGNYFVPLLGFDWWINNRDKLFGILPGNMTFEHKVNKLLYYGITFNAITNSYRDQANQYFRVDDNQLGIFGDVYFTKNIVVNTEIGHSLFRKLRIGEKNVFENDLAVNDNFYIRLMLAYRVRFY